MILTLLATSAVAMPIVKPVSVMAADVKAATAPLLTFKTIKLSLWNITFAVAAPLRETEGVGDCWKKLAG